MEKKTIDLGLITVGFFGMIILSLMAIVDSQATDITSGVIVQLFFAALFVAGYISYNHQDEKEK